MSKCSYQGGKWATGKWVDGIWVADRCCNHERDVVSVGGRFVLASEYSFNFDVWKKPVPDLGIYLCSTWEGFFVRPKIQGELVGFEEYEPSYPTIIFECDDGGMIDHKTLDWLVKGIINNIEQGKLVEVGCFGGHGRTGTLLACIVGRYEGKDARKAILAVRSRYCESAVETKRQIWAIVGYLNSPPSTVDKIEPSRSPVQVLYTQVQPYVD